MHHLLARCTAILSLLFTFAALAQPAVGEGPALKVFNAWLAAFNSGDAAQYKAFDDAYKPARSLSTLAQARQQTGGFVLLRVESVDATKVVALLKEKQSENVARMELLVTADDPPKMVSARLNLIPPPPDIAPARRFTEALSLFDSGEATARIVGSNRIGLDYSHVPVAIAELDPDHVRRLRAAIGALLAIMLGAGAFGRQAFAAAGAATMPACRSGPNSSSRPRRATGANSSSACSSTSAAAVFTLRGLATGRIVVNGRIRVKAERSPGSSNCSSSKLERATHALPTALD